jgi:hypothetical protein
VGVPGGAEAFFHLHANRRHVAEPRVHRRHARAGGGCFERAPDNHRAFPCSSRRAARARDVAGRRGDA